MPLKKFHNTFHGDITPEILPPCTVLYRVLDPQSNDNAVFWMSKLEFDALHSKPEWRERFAVWKYWNVNGEYLTYTIPPGKGMPVWRGKAASQRFEKNGVPVPADKEGNFYWIDGGHEQIAVDPKLLDRQYASQREFTGWGYDEGEIEANLVGVPILEQNWRN